MGHCVDCGSEVGELVTSDTRGTYSDVTVWECPECGAILGVTEFGV